MRLPHMLIQMAVDSYMVEWRLSRSAIGDSTRRHCAGKMVGLQMLNLMRIVNSFGASSDCGKRKSVKCLISFSTYIEMLGADLPELNHVGVLNLLPVNLSPPLSYHVQVISALTQL